MTIKFSTGLKNAILATGSLAAALGDGTLDLYTNVQPANADSSPNGTLICSITCVAKVVAGGGLYFDTANVSGGTLSKFAGDLWAGDGINGGGTAGWFRFRKSGQAAGVSGATNVNFDGSVGTSGADLNGQSITIVAGAPNVITSFSVTLP